MPITYQQAVTEHRKMWNWIAEQTELYQTCFSKDNYLELMGNTKLTNDCFLCQYTVRRWRDEPWSTQNYCDYCIGIWSENPEKNCSLTTYGAWCQAYRKDDWELAAKYARLIAHLPIKPLQKATNMQWDTTNAEPGSQKLPSEITLPRAVRTETEIHEFIKFQFKFLAEKNITLKSFDIKPTKENKTGESPENEE